MTSAGDESGSSLMLMPAALLVVLLLAAIAVDAAAIRMQARELEHVARSAANDAVVAGIATDAETFRDRGSIRIDHSRARAIVRSAIRARGLDDVTLESISIDRRVDGSESVTVRLSREARHVLRPPGTPETVTIRAAVTAAQHIE